MARRPWADDPRADAKDALLAFALAHPEGAPIVQAARDALASETGVTDADHRLALRFYDEDYSHLFKTARRDGLVWVEPEPWASLLNSSRQSPPRVDDDRHARPTGRGFLPARAPTGRAAGVARSVLRDRCGITPGPTGAGVRSALTHALAAHREGVDTAGMRSDRVSAPRRVAAVQASFLGACEAAAARYRSGVLLTLTARPGESGDMVDTAVAVNESVGPLRKWLGRRTPGAGSPPSVVVREVTARGVLHLHVVVFGVTPADVDRDALSAYWHETRGHGYIVDCAPVERRACRWVFADHATAGTARGRYVRAYLGETLHRFRAVADAAPEELHAGAVPGAWRVALLWACGLPLVSVSTALRESPARLTARGGVGPRRRRAATAERGARRLPTAPDLGGKGWVGGTTKRRRRRDSRGGKPPPSL